MTELDQIYTQTRKLFGDAVADRMRQSMELYLLGRPELAECDTGSLVDVALRAARLNLDPGVHCTFQARAKNGSSKKHASMIIQYEGSLRIMSAAGMTCELTGVIRQGEHFALRGKEVLEHVPGDGRGKILYSYARAITETGVRVHSLCTEADLERAEARSTGKVWKTDRAPMAEKTAIHRLLKVAPNLDEAVIEALRMIDTDHLERPSRRLSSQRLALPMPTPALTGPDTASEPATTTVATIDDF